MNRRATLAFAVGLIAFIVSCSGPNARSDEDAASAGTFCEQYAALSSELGCTDQIDCSRILPACESLARAWIECVQRDTSQCYCEGDRSLNCEGSFKPNEGPALCIDEYSDYRVCSGD